MAPSFRAHPLVLACAVCAALLLGQRQAQAQGRDDLLNGVLLGAAVGAAGGVAFAHAVRDSDLSVGQYAYGALVFGAIGAAAGLGIDALLNRAGLIGPQAARRVSIRPAVWRDTAGVAVMWSW